MDFAYTPYGPLGAILGPAPQDPPPGGAWGVYAKSLFLWKHYMIQNEQGILTYPHGPLGGILGGIPPRPFQCFVVEKVMYPPPLREPWNPRSRWETFKFCWQTNFSSLRRACLKVSQENGPPGGDPGTRVPGYTPRGAMGVYQNPLFI